MKKHTLLPIIALVMGAGSAAAQNTVITEESVTVAEVPSCDVKYTNSWRDGWFVQLGAGVNIPISESFDYDNIKVGAQYTAGFGRWFSPYFGFRFTGAYGNVVETFSNRGVMHYRSGSIYGDIMWDMCNSIGGVNLNRPVSVVPFVGIGGTYNYHFTGYTDEMNVMTGSHVRDNQWTVPVSAGLQLRFRLCRYVDFFLEGRAIVSGDNSNNIVQGRPIDLSFQGTGGLTFNIGGKSFETYDPCAYNAYIADLNGQVNDLRAELAVTAASLAEAESQLPCPEVTTVVTEVAAPAPAPLMSTVRFTINSAKVSPMEMVNVYNVAEYMKANPDTKVTIVGYADKDTGTADYNLKLSEKRAQAVYDILVNNYGISADRLTKSAEGSAQQPYGTNNWNRIVIFNQQ